MAKAIPLRPLIGVAVIVTALMTAGAIGLCAWIISTLSEVQLAVREVSTQLSAKGAIEQRFQSIEQRVTRLEAEHRGMPE